MNRSILIVICDFLLLSLLAFSTVDINKVTDQGPARLAQGQGESATNQIDRGNDLAAVMRLALQEERKGRDQLLGELARTRQTTGAQQTLLSEREKQVQTFQQQLQTREQEAAQLQQQFAAAQTNIEVLNQQLHTTSSEALISAEKMAAMRAELQKQAELAAAFQQQLAQLAKNNQTALAEKQQLAAKLQGGKALGGRASRPDAGGSQGGARGESEIG